MINYCVNKASKMKIYSHLKVCDSLFYPILSKRVNLNDYSEKLSIKSTTFEAWYKDELIGLIAGYYNTEKKFFFISNFSVEKKFGRKGIASNILLNLKKYNKNKQFFKILLEVNLNNTNAVSFYKKRGFLILKKEDNILTMQHEYEK